MQLRVTATVEAETKTALAAPAVAIVALAQAVEDVIVNLAVIHDGAIPVEGFP